MRINAGGSAGQVHGVGRVRVSDDGLPVLAHARLRVYVSGLLEGGLDTASKIDPRLGSPRCTHLDDVLLGDGPSMDSHLLMHYLWLSVVLHIARLSVEDHP